MKKKTQKNIQKQRVIREKNGQGLRISLQIYYKER